MAFVENLLFQEKFCSSEVKIQPRAANTGYAMSYPTRCKATFRNLSIFGSRKSGERECRAGE
jgi:hypothetical protein